MLRVLRRYRSAPALAALAVALSAFAPAPLLSCAPTPTVPTPEIPAAAPCHGMTVDQGVAMHHPTTEAPARAPAPQPDMRCCPSKAPLAPAPEQPAPIAAVTAQLLDAVTVLAPAVPPRPVPASDASPPPRAALHLLFGCFLT